MYYHVPINKGMCSPITSNQKLSYQPSTNEDPIQHLPYTICTIQLKLTKVFTFKIPLTRACTLQLPPINACILQFSPTRSCTLPFPLIKAHAFQSQQTRAYIVLLDLDRPNFSIHQPESVLIHIL